MSETALQRSIRERLARNRQEKEAAKEAAGEVPPPPLTPSAAPSVVAPWAAFTDAVPTLSLEQRRSEAEIQIDEALVNLDVLTAYNRYCRKMKPTVPAGKREGVMISCPKPDHPDKNPSAWMNLDNNTWFCGGCQEGGDQYDIAALNLGYDKSYKEGLNWGNFRKRIAEDMGLVIEYVPGVGDTVQKVVDEEELRAEIAAAPVPEPPPSPVRVPPGALNWRAVVTENSFLDLYMKAVIVDDVPEEYHFWHAMMGLGVMVGRDAYIQDGPPVRGNLFICMLGQTGSGKSKSKYHLTKVLDMAYPYDPNEKIPKGVKPVPTPASAEAMIKGFQCDIEVIAPSGQKYVDYAPVRGIVEFPELKQLTGRMARQGSVLKETLIEFFDCTDMVASIAAGRDGQRIAKEPTASVLTTVQPEVLADVFSDNDEVGGFLNRWLFITGTEKPIQIVNRNVIDLKPAADELRRIHTWAAKGRPIELTYDAQDVIQEAWDSYIHEDRKNHPHAMARILLMIKKLALILALNEMSTEITPEIVRKVLLMYPYLFNTIKFRGDAIAMSIEQQLDEDILNVFRKNPTEPLTGQRVIRALPRRSEGGGRSAGAPKINRHLDELAKAGYLNKQPTKAANGKTVTMFHYLGES